VMWNQTIAIQFYLRSVGASSQHTSPRHQRRSTPDVSPSHQDFPCPGNFRNKNPGLSRIF